MMLIHTNTVMEIYNHVFKQTDMFLVIFVNTLIG